MPRWSAKPDKPERVLRLEVMAQVHNDRDLEFWQAFVESIQDFLSDPDWANLNLLMVESEI